MSGRVSAAGLLYRGSLYQFYLSFARPLCSLLAKNSLPRPLGLSLKYVCLAPWRGYQPLGRLRGSFSDEESLKHSPAAGDHGGSPTHSHGVDRSVVCGLRAISAPISHSPKKNITRSVETPAAPRREATNLATCIPPLQCTRWRGSPWGLPEGSALLLSKSCRGTSATSIQPKSVLTLRAHRLSASRV